jgi:Asp-tRNA(Asn)/Glu-tRNA(Gln) amidotransferase A subunit family amidase
VSPTELHTLTAAALVAAVRAGRLSVVAVVEALLARIDRLDAALSAWVAVDREGALAQARTLDEEARAGRVRGPLHGVPVALKDIFDASGLITTSGAAAFAHRRAEHDARSVALLRRAGAVILGKTATTPFAFADPSPTRNPWNRAHTPGGSSSGSAAAVAARMAPLALGSQTIGSTVRPAAYCGIVGVKPTWGRISTEGVTPLSWSLDHVGVLARTVDDAALAYAVLAEPPEPGDLGSAAAPQPPRLGVPRRLVEAHASPEMAAHLDEVAAVLRRHGAAVVDVELPSSTDRIVDAGRLVLKVEAAAYHRRWFPAHAAEYPPRIRGLVEEGLRVSGVEYLAANEERDRFRREMSEAFARGELLLLPSAPAAAPPLAEGTTGDPIFCAPWSFGGFPSLGLPSGLSKGGLPLGVQLVAPGRAERRLFDAARWCEAVLDFRAAPPL